MNDMNTNENHHEPVERALGAWRDEEVPEHIYQAARPHLDHLRAQMASATGPAPIVHGRMLMAFALAIVTVLIAAIIAVTVDFTGEPPVAFAEVMRQLEKFRPYTCTVSMRHSGKTTQEYKQFQYSLTKRRQELADGTIQIVDIEARRALQLTPDGKAILQELPKDGPDRDFDLLTMATGIGDAKPELLGYRQFGGVRAFGFHAAYPGGVFTIWIDPETQLPVYFAVEHPERNREIVHANFDFDDALDVALFSTTPPEGFELIQHIPAPFVPDALPVKPAVTDFVPHAFTRVVVTEDGTVSPPERVVQQSRTQRREVATDGTITVFDLDTGRTLTLNPESKEATVTSGEGGQRDMNLLGRVAEFIETPTEIFGFDEIDGKQVWGFRYEVPYNVFDVWLDVETGYPVEVDITHPSQGRTIRMTDFDFKIDLDPALFSTEPPAGYTIIE